MKKCEKISAHWLSRDRAVARHMAGETLKGKTNFEIFRSRGTKLSGGGVRRILVTGHPVHIRVRARTYVEQNAKGAELRLNKTVMTVAGDWGGKKN